MDSNNDCEMPTQEDIAKKKAVLAELNLPKLLNDKKMQQIIKIVNDPKSAIIIGSNDGTCRLGGRLYGGDGDEQKKHWKWAAWAIKSTITMLCSKVIIGITTEFILNQLPEGLRNLICTFISGKPAASYGCENPLLAAINNGMDKVNPGKGFGCNNSHVNCTDAAQTIANWTSMGIVAAMPKIEERLKEWGFDIKGGKKTRRNKKSKKARKTKNSRKSKR